MAPPLPLPLAGETLLYGETFAGPDLAPTVPFTKPLHLGFTGFRGPPPAGLMLDPAYGSMPQPSDGLPLSIDGNAEPASISLSVELGGPVVNFKRLRLVVGLETLAGLKSDAGPWIAGVFFREGLVGDTRLEARGVGGTLKFSGDNATAARRAPRLRAESVNAKPGDGINAMAMGASIMPSAPGGGACARRSNDAGGVSPTTRPAP